MTVYVLSLEERSMGAGTVSLSVHLTERGAKEAANKREGRTLTWTTFFDGTRGWVAYADDYEMDAYAVEPVKVKP